MKPDQPARTCPMDQAAVIDAYFMEHRAKVIDVAAFLDRVERAGGGTAGGNDAPYGANADPKGDFRVAAMRRALAILLDGQPDRARRVLESFSDPSFEPIAAAGMKGATGAYAGSAPAARL